MTVAELIEILKTLPPNDKIIDKWGYFINNVDHQEGNKVKIECMIL